MGINTNPQIHLESLNSLDLPISESPSSNNILSLSVLSCVSIVSIDYGSLLCLLLCFIFM